jgi:hypothetical protein
MSLISFKINKTKLSNQFIGNTDSVFTFGNSDLNHSCPSTHFCGAVFYLGVPNHNKIKLILFPSILIQISAQQFSDL